MMMMMMMDAGQAVSRDLLEYMHVTPQQQRMDGKQARNQTEKTHPEDHNTRIVERNRKKEKEEEKKKRIKTPRDTYVIQKEKLM